MKLSPWWWGGGGGLAALGLGAVALALFEVGWPESVESAGGEGKSAGAEGKEKVAEFKGKVEEMVINKKSLQELSNHRVFVSRSLIFLPKEAEPVQALDPKQVTEDGMEVGWKLKYGFSPEDPEVGGLDEDQDGFTNLEEYLKKTDPKDSASSPSKWIKLKIAAVEATKLAVSFSGKSAGRYTLRFKTGGKPKDVDVGTGDKLWVVAGGKGVDIYKSEEEVKGKVGGTNACAHAIPVLVKEYQEDKGVRMDEKTKTENEYDDSLIVLERMDDLNGPVSLKIDERGKSRGVEWAAGDVRLVSLVPGEGEMGPYRPGQSFPYAGKTFVVVAANEKKVSLRMKPEGEMVDILPKEIPTASP